MVFFLGNGFVEVSGGKDDDGGTRGDGGEVGDGGVRDGGGTSSGGSRETALWLQVRDVEAEHQRLKQAGATITRAPQQEPWGLVEMWLTDPEGLPIVVVEIPEDHPLRRDQR